MFRIAVALIVLCGCVVSDANAEKLLLISIDGLHPGYVLEADRYGLRVPTLRRIVQEGTYATGVVGVVPSVTYPSHTTMLTGVAPARHGIESNTTFDPTNKNRDGWYWYAEDIKTPTLWAAAKRANLRTASVNWPVTVGDEHIDYLLPEYWRASTADDVKLMRALTKPTNLMQRYEAELGSFIDGYVDTLESDRIRTRFAVKLIREQRPDFTAVHLIALDGVEHRDGPWVASVFETLEALDAMIGELQAAALANDPRTVTAVVSDHGFQATHTAVNLRVPFVEAGLIKLKTNAAHASAAIQSWDAQAWPGGAVAAIVLREPNDRAVRARVEKLLQTLRANPKNGIARILDRAELGNVGAFSNAEWLVEFEPGFYFGGELQEAIVTPGSSKGTHGYLPERPQMHASLFMSGVTVQPKNLGVIDMRQLAPTFATLLGIAFDSAEKPALRVARGSTE